MVSDAYAFPEARKGVAPGCIRRRGMRPVFFVVLVLLSFLGPCPVRWRMCWPAGIVFLSSRWLPSCPNKCFWSAPRFSTACKCWRTFMEPRSIRLRGNGYCRSSARSTNVCCGFVARTNRGVCLVAGTVRFVSRSKFLERPKRSAVCWTGHIRPSSRCCVHTGRLHAACTMAGTRRGIATPIRPLSRPPRARWPAALPVPAASRPVPRSEDHDARVRGFGVRGFASVASASVARARVAAPPSRPCVALLGTSIQRWGPAAFSPARALHVASPVFAFARLGAVQVAGRPFPDRPYAVWRSVLL